jgi:hypothetical protein
LNSKGDTETTQVARPDSFTINVIGPGTAKRIAETCVTMPLDVLKRRALEFENQLAAWENGKLPLTANDRLEIAESLKALNKRIDELMPIVPASLGIGDNFSVEPVAERWPIELPTHTRQIHMHFRELVYAWQINPFRNTDSSQTVTVDEFAETSGISRFVFEDAQDAGNFIDHFALEDFVKVDATPTGSNHPTTGRPFFYIELTNKFAREDVAEFIEVYSSAIMALSVIHDERRRAISMDNGRYGFVTSDHFTARETLALCEIAGARIKLGAGYKSLTKKDGQ